MRDPIRLGNFAFKPAPQEDQRRGLLGWIRCEVNEQLGLDGLALRRTASGDLTIGFPSRRDSAGQTHPYLRPLDAEARRQLEEQVLEALRREHGRLL